MEIRQGVCRCRGVMRVMSEFGKGGLEACGPRGECALLKYARVGSFLCPRITLCELRSHLPVSSRTLAEPARCRRVVARLAIRDPGMTVDSALRAALGPGSNTRQQLLAQLGSCSGRDDSPYYDVPVSEWRPLPCSWFRECSLFWKRRGLPCSACCHRETGQDDDYICEQNRQI